MGVAPEARIKLSYKDDSCSWHTLAKFLAIFLDRKWHTLAVDWTFRTLSGSWLGLHVSLLLTSL